MKRGIVILVTAVGVGLCMFWCSHRVLALRTSESAKSMPKENGSLLPELHWLQGWLHLDDGQMQKVKALHLAYLPKCEDLCHRVYLSNQDILALSAQSTTVDDKMRSAMDERAKLTVECQQALLEHVYQIAACLRPEQSRRYLGLMVPYTLGIPAKDTARIGAQP
ncbi:MAG: periplasmic heavy metal sensor [Verrucomicrobiaceae bacterium]|nr:periplasmic heavy metal sensor [Verrucomicrobiaceae bacterium]